MFQKLAGPASSASARLETLRIAKEHLGAAQGSEASSAVALLDREADLINRQGLRKRHWNMHEFHSQWLKIEHRCVRMQGKERSGTGRVDEAPANLVCSGHEAFLTKPDMTCNACLVLLVTWPNKEVHAKVESSCCSSSHIPALVTQPTA